MTAPIRALLTARNIPILTYGFKRNIEENSGRLYLVLMPVRPPLCQTQTRNAKPKSNPAISSNSGIDNRSLLSDGRHHEILLGDMNVINRQEADETSESKI